MRIEEKIKHLLEKEFSPTHLQVVNESHKHAGHAGDDGSGQTHFKLKVVSVDFGGKSRVQRQRLVNQAIGGLFDEGLHAVSMQLSTPEEDKI